MLVKPRSRSTVDEWCPLLLAADASAQLHPEVRRDGKVPVAAPPSPPMTLTIPPLLA
jgi:hypothetical protein